MKRNLLFIIALFVCALSYSQGEIDAYRYTNNDLSGTARGQAMGGAFGALGGDVTGVAINPAGIGVYRSSEVVANMSIASPLINGNTNQQSNTAFSFDNLSYMVYYPLVNGSMLNLNYGFNYNRIKSFDQCYSTSRPTMNSSLTDYMANLTNGFSHSGWDGSDYYSTTNLPWLSILGYDGYVINPINNTTNQYGSVLAPGEQVSPSLKVSEKGSVELYDFTIGSNIANKFFWGATFSIVDLYNLMTSSYDESFRNGGGMTLGNYLETKGSGFQMKAGIIYKPIDALRIGVAYHSPVWYSMTDYYQASLIPRGIYADDGTLVGMTSTPDNAATNYQFRTPGSWTLSLAAVLGTQAIVSLDYENKDYRSMNLKDADGIDWTDENKTIYRDYKDASTVRAGIEYRFTPQFSGRLGYAWAQNPYSSDIRSVGNYLAPSGTIPNYTLTGNVNYLTAGIGFRFTPEFYGDFALVLRTQKDDLYYFPPSIGGNTFADSFGGTFTNKILKGLITLGYKF